MCLLFIKGLSNQLATKCPSFEPELIRRAKDFRLEEESSNLIYQRIHRFGSDLLLTALHCCDVLDRICTELH